MSDGSTRVDDLVRTLLPKAAIPKHLRPSLLLDDDVVPPPRVAEKVEALRQLVRTGGRCDDVFGPVQTSRDIAAYFTPRLAAHPFESLWVVGLTAKNGARVVRCVARGSIESCPVSVRDVLRIPVVNACPALVMVHNHPSGDPQPSADDVAITDRIRKGGELLGVRLLDHVIVASKGHFSFLDAGLLAR